MSELSTPPAQVLPAGDWVRSTFCGPNGGNCVEVNGGVAGFTGVRDSKPATSSALVFTGQRWQDFVAQVRIDGFAR